MSIGAFSRASFLSVKALRAYHEAGLFVPARVDPETGYRIYHSSQLVDAAVIHRLRSLDLPLRQIREILDARDPAVTSKILDEHRRSKESELDAITRIVSQLQADVDVPEAHTPVHERDEPHQHTLAFSGTAGLDEFSTFLGHAYATLGEVLVSSLAVPSGAGGALYANELADDGPEDIEAYIPIQSTVTVDHPRVVLGELPAERVAVLVHHGPYETIGDTYRRLGAWVAHHAEPAGTRVREIYTVSVTDTDDPDQFRTEICWPIASPFTPTTNTHTDTHIEETT